jgi:hypothetical protein
MLRLFVYEMIIILVLISFQSKEKVEKVRKVRNQQVMVKNGKLVDRNGGTVILRGLGLGHWLCPEGYFQGTLNKKIIIILVKDYNGFSKSSCSFWSDIYAQRITENYRLI